MSGAIPAVAATSLNSWPPNSDIRRLSSCLPSGSKDLNRRVLEGIAYDTAWTSTMNKLTINDLDLRGKRVFIRVDFNVPLKDAVVTDDTRIRETLPTLRLAIQKGARLVLASHLGRPKGGPDSKFSLKSAARKLEELLGKPVAFALDCVGPGAEGQSKALRDGEVLVLENVRFHPEEEKN